MRFAVIVTAIVALAGLAPGQSAKPDEQPTVFLENNRPKSEKDPRTRTIEGVVKDSADNPLSNAIVQLKNLKTSKTVAFPTKEDGRFAFRDLPMDNDFELVAKRGELSAPLRKITVYDTRKYLIVNFQLTPPKQ
jgi:hypothetical protein